MARVRQKFFADLACEVGISKGMAAQLPATLIEPSAIYEAVAGRGDVLGVVRQLRALTLPQFELMLIALAAYVNETHQRDKSVEGVRYSVIKLIFNDEAK